MGVLVDGPTLLSWEHAILKEVLADPRFELTLVVRNTVPHFTFAEKLRLRWRRAPWAVLNRVEDRLSQALFARRRPPQHRDIDADNPLAEIWADTGRAPVQMDVNPETTPNKLVHRFPAADVARVEALKLDVILRFGFNILRGPILGAARHGIWSFHHGDHNIYRGGPPGFWEVAHDAPATGWMLQILADDLDNGRVLARGHVTTFRRSWNENRRRVTAKSARFLVEALKTLAATGAPPACEPRSEAPLCLFDRPITKVPLARDLSLATARILWRNFGHVLNARLFRNEWRILLARGPLAGRSLRNLEEIAPPPGRFWADPFLVRRDGEARIFFEDYDFATCVGRIASVRIAPDAGVGKTSRASDFRVALERPYHLSYPFMFEWRGAFYMIPESFKNGTVELWRCARFPDGWEKAGTILDGVSAADATLLEHDGRWWLFVNIDRSGFGEHGDELSIFHTLDPVAGPWLPHAANPVVVDARVARMGGGFMRLPGGRLVRCAQKGGEVYGSGLVLMAVDELSAERYREHRLEEVGPHWRPDGVGIHHLHAIDGLAVLDACVRKPRWR